MGKKVKVINEDSVEYDGQKWKVRYNETSATLQKRKVVNGINKVERIDVCESPYDIEKKYLSDGYVVKEAHNWKKIVKESHNSDKGINKRRQELTVQADGLHGDGSVYTDEQIEDETNPKSGSRINIAKGWNTLTTWVKIVVVGTLILVIALTIGMLKLKRYI